MLFTIFSIRSFVNIFGLSHGAYWQEVKRPPLNDVLRRLSGSLKKLRQTLGEVEKDEEPAAEAGNDARSA
ncbi:MAG: hypothetical protein HY340_02645 [Candidatus Kerfeldbacteria bacterium]|nr:hypothetical protein [Candidatus Kerfeldbacteria bacterium]